MHDASSLVPAAPAAAAPDILGIEPALARIVGEGAGPERLGALADFLRRLTNARAMLLFATGEGTLHAEAWADAEPEREALAAAAASLLVGEGGVSRASARPLPGAAGLFLLSSPLTRGGEGEAAVPFRACLLLAAGSLRELEPFLVVLQTAAGFFHAALDRGEGGPGGEALLQAAALVEIGTAAGGAADFSGAAALLAEQLRRHFGCFWVCLGAARGEGIRLEAVSGVARFEKEGASTAAIEAAMREAVLRGRPVEYPAPPGSDDALSGLAHRELVRLSEVERALTIPLHRADGRPLGALTFLWDAAHPFRPGSERLIEASAPYLQSQIEVLRRADPAPWKRWWLHGWKRLSRRRRQAILAACGAGLLLLLCPLPQHIHVSCRVQPREKRIVSAPFDGTLKEALVEPGQSVAQGAPLALLDDKELRWHEAELQAARDQSLTLRNQKMTDGDSAYALSQVQQLEAQQHDLDLRVVEYKIAHLEVVSPVDGVILSGDLKRAIGAPVSKGQVLFEVAPLDKLAVDLDIPDADAASVRDGMPLSVRFEAMPGRKWEGAIRKVNPQSEAREGENVFIAEADLPAEAAGLRPGMEGKAVVYGDAKPLGWLLFHRLWSFFRMLFFW